MAEDDEHKPHHATARPPPGEEDVYSASTVVGEASDEILAIIRGEQSKGALPGAPGLPKNLKVDPKSDSKIEAPRPAAGASPAQVIKTPVAEPVRFPPPDGPKPAYTSTPLDVPVTQLTATTDPPKGVVIAPDPEPAPVSTPPALEADLLAPPQPPPPPVVTSPPAALASATDDNPNFKKGTLHPAVGIVLFFIAVVAVLAALIR